MASLATSRDCFKGAIVRRRWSVGMTGPAPLGAVFHNPIGQGALEADVLARLLRFDPFVFENLLALGLEFAVERGVLYQIIPRWGAFCLVRHGSEHIVCNKYVTLAVPRQS